MIPVSNRRFEASARQNLRYNKLGCASLIARSTAQLRVIRATPLCSSVEDEALLLYLLFVFYLHIPTLSTTDEQTDGAGKATRPAFFKYATVQPTRSTLVSELMKRA